MKCDRCQAETFLPFTCLYCGGHFCSEHRLPENHECPRMDLARLPKEKARPLAPQKGKSYEHSVIYTPPSKTNARMRFSKKEIGHLSVATLLVIAVGLSFIGLLGLPSGNNVLNYAAVIVFVMMFSASFFAHEMAHKFVAQKEGYWAEFRLTLVGAALTLLSVIPIVFKIIAPGAVMIGGPADRRQVGRISIAGPATNIILSSTLLGAAILVPDYQRIFLAGAAFNAWIALFNLIPYGIFDGLKVFGWNKKIWLAAFAVSLTLTAVSYVLL
jgi:Zn-dependent protease